MNEQEQQVYYQRRVANLMHQFNCNRETAIRITELREEGYPLHQAALMAGAKWPGATQQVVNRV